MKHQLLVVCAVVATLAAGTRARAGEVPFRIAGAGFDGSGTLTYEPDTVAGDPVGAFTITGISGTFSDANIGLASTAIAGLVAIDPVNPAYGAPFPVSLSLYSVANPPPNDSAISYDNLFYPGGSPITCPDYPGAGGYLDVYGVMFTLSNGDVVDLWSNGVIPGGPPLNYGVAVIDGPSTIVDFQSGGLSMAVPEPGSSCLLLTGLIGALAWRRRATSAPRARLSSAG